MKINWIEFLSGAALLIFGYFDQNLHRWEFAFVFVLGWLLVMHVVVAVGNLMKPSKK